MSFHDITFGCGHSGTVEIRSETGKKNLDFYRSKRSICNGCYEKKRKELDGINLAYNNIQQERCTFREFEAALLKVIKLSSFKDNVEHAKTLYNRILKWREEK